MGAIDSIVAGAEEREESAGLEAVSGFTRSRQACDIVLTCRATDRIDGDCLEVMRDLPRHTFEGQRDQSTLRHAGDVLHDASNGRAEWSDTVHYCPDGGEGLFQAASTLLKTDSQMADYCGADAMAAFTPVMYGTSRLSASRASGTNEPTSAGWDPRGKDVKQSWSSCHTHRSSAIGGQSIKPGCGT